jgi:hypothetical protein
MKKSKYLGLKSGEWTCTHIGVDRVQPALTHFRGDNGKKIRSKRPGHQTYYYIFERLTSDKKAMKMIRLNAAQARQVLCNWFTVEDFARKKAAKRSQEFTDKVSYSFCD